ncbi:Major sperm protein [Aphelenchoides besseyi]|nr:Major sperm protein [Aphelenchoides besseyi]KAI6199125.1 Major sperm protein [Aphelenchoides besseyi]
MISLRQIEEEEDHGLYVSPHVAQYSSRSGGASRHLMANETNNRLAIKIKCSNNDVYRVSSVYTILEPGYSQRLQVVRDPGKPGTDKLILLYKPTNCKNAYDAFHSEDNEPVQKTIIICVAKEPPKLASFDDFTVDEAKTHAQPKPRKSQSHIAVEPSIRFPNSMHNFQKLAAKPKRTKTS